MGWSGALCLGPSRCGRLLSFLPWEYQASHLPRGLPSSAEGAVSSYLLICLWLRRVFTAAQAFLYLRQARAPLVAAQGLLIAVASVVAEHRLEGARASGVAARGLGSCVPGLWSTGSAAVHRLSCSVASGIFADQVLNLHW